MPYYPTRPRGAGAGSSLIVYRRDVLKLASAGFTLAALPELAGCSVDRARAPDQPQEPQSASDATWFSVVRIADLVVLRFGLLGLEVRNRKSTTPPAGLSLKGDLYLARTKDPAFLLIDLQPQHILEAAFDEIGSHKPSGSAVMHRMAHRSRLAFYLPATTTAIPFELDPLLAALTGLTMNVGPTAVDDPPGANTIYVPTFMDPALPGASPDASMSLARATSMARAWRAQRAFFRANPDALLRGAGSAVQQVRDLVIRPVPKAPQAPTDLETSIELPYRLQLSPNWHGHWEHATEPVVSAESKRVELWHTRLSTPENWQKTLRALWARDSSFNPLDASGVTYPDPDPFYASMRPADRGDIVHLTTNFNLLDRAKAQRARALPVDMLMLSALGGWLDCHASWSDPPLTGGPSLVGWDHHATMARDQKVRIARAGFLYPYGHEAVWVTISERKFLPGYDDTAYVWKRNFVVVKTPLKTYDGLPDNLARGLAFTTVRFKTVVTRDIDPLAAIDGAFPNSSWVLVNSTALPFELEAFDHEGGAHTFSTSCIFLDANDVAKSFAAHADALDKIWSASYSDGERRRSPMKSQRVALAPSAQADDTRYTAESMAHKAVTLLSNAVPFIPQLDDAELVVDTIRGLTGATASTKFQYLQHYLDNGFDALDSVSPKNIGGVFMKLTSDASAAALTLSNMSDRSGGFVAPDLNLSGLSRAQGLIAGSVDDLAAGHFDPTKFFDAIGAKLFGVVSLKDLILEVLPGAGDALKQAPKFLTQALDAAEMVFHLFKDGSSIVEDLKKRVLARIDEVIAAIPNVTPLTRTLNPTIALDALQTALYQRVLTQAACLGLTPAQLQAESKQLSTALDAVAAAALAIAADLEKVTGITPTTDLNTLADGIVNDIDTGRKALAKLGDVLKTLVLPIDDGIKTRLLGFYDKVVNKILPDQAALDTFKLAVKGFVNAEEAIKSMHVKLDWNPDIQPWPDPINAIFYPNDPKSFHLGVEIRAKAAGGQPAGVDVFASMTDFDLRLIGATPYIKLVFDKLAFVAGSNTKPAIDCVFRGIHFGGPLEFIEKIRSFIPLKGFSDPPNVQVSAEGLKANFSLHLPNIAIGVFSLENLSFSAGFDIPFLGKALTVSFAFCSRESPFVLTVSMLGGGGFVGLTIAPDGVRLLEISLEAQACLALDLGVASGSVAVALGVYFAIESDDVKLTGYLRIRGAVNVLGLITASIELKMELSYESSTGKVIGHASLEIEVSVFCFSVSVTLECERKFAGSKGDPTFRQIMAYDPVSSYQPWDDYCTAFAPVLP